MRSLLLLLTLVAAVAPAQSLDKYLQLRKQYGISQAVGVPALETLVGTRVFELKGTVKGTFRVGDKGAILLERTDGNTEIVDTSAIPEWLAGNEVPARLIVRATRAKENESLVAVLIGAAPEHRIAEIERVEAEKAAARRRLMAKNNPKPTATPPVSRGGTRSAAKDWNLPASEVTPIYASFIKTRNPRLPNSEAMRIAEGIVGFSLKYGVDARLIMAMVMIESGFNPNATSRAGAMGLGQLMPGTAKGMGVGNPYDSMQNLSACVKIVRGHLDKYKKKTGDPFESLILMLAAYNSGSGTVRRFGGVPPYRETQNYVRKVISLYYQFAGREAGK